MKQYKKIIDGITVIKLRSQIVINKDGKQYIGVEKAILEDGWEEYTKPEPTEAELLQNEKYIKKMMINNYDTSDEINQFTFNGVQMWLDKATRAGLKLRFESEAAMGKTETTLWYGDLQISLTLTNAIQLLYAIEVYASACYDNTQRHLAAVNQITTLEELKNYNYKEGYPEKLVL